LSGTAQQPERRPAITLAREKADPFSTRSAAGLRAPIVGLMTIPFSNSGPTASATRDWQRIIHASVRERAWQMILLCDHIGYTHTEPWPVRRSRPRNERNASASVPAGSFGSYCGARLQSRLPERNLRRLLGLIACLVAARYLQTTVTDTGSRPQPARHAQPA